MACLELKEDIVSKTTFKVAMGLLLKMVFGLKFMVSNSEVVSFCPSETFTLLRADSLNLQETRPSTLGRSGRLEGQMSESTILAQWTCVPVSRPALLRCRLPRHLGRRTSVTLSE